MYSYIRNLYYRLNKYMYNAAKFDYVFAIVTSFVLTGIFVFFAIYMAGEDTYITTTINTTTYDAICVYKKFISSIKIPPFSSFISEQIFL